MTAMRKYKEKDIKRLITAAGGRCSYHYGNDECMRLLVINNSVIGEKAHIVAVSPKGPRYRKNYDPKKINDYENLIWLCPTHHSIIDKMDDIGIYSEQIIIDMKITHERKINKLINTHDLNLNFTLYDSVTHDYTLLSSFFEYVDINKLYSCTLDLPRKLGYSFNELRNIFDAFENGGGEFRLQDKYLQKLFFKMLEHEKILWNKITEYFYIEPEIDVRYRTDQFVCTPIHGSNKSKHDWVAYWTCCYQEAVDIFINAIRLRYPQILTQQTYKLGD